ncbi:MAG: hypothetical protein GTO46_09590 [Gemmatimonadetes bacterium]|nr:hypothetical protein [Gemmatimonadota bacterium]NIO31865.1 hypothetical protein [Gemmatimonadota bacterium]
MNRLITRLATELKAAETTYDLGSASVKTVSLLPLILIFGYSLALVVDTTRSAALALRGENHPIELLTFLFLLIGGILGTVLTLQSRKHREPGWLVGFYAVFSVGLLFTAMEEVAWGQYFFGFATPTSLAEVNVLDDFTLHNIRGLHGHTEFFRVAFGFGGLLGIWVSTRPALRKIGVPLIMLPWFLVIAGHASVDLPLDYISIEGRFDNLVGKLAEYVEMLIGMSGLLYVWLNGRMLRGEWRGAGTMLH